WERRSRFTIGHASTWNGRCVVHSWFGRQISEVWCVSALVAIPSRLTFRGATRPTETARRFVRRVSTHLAIALLLVALSSAEQKKIKVIADQDSAGPQGTNFLSLLMLLRAPQIDLLGITTVSGDQWMEPASVFALWA